MPSPRTFAGLLIASWFGLSTAVVAAPPASSPTDALLSAAKGAMMAQPQKAHDFAEAALKSASAEPSSPARERDEIAANWLRGEALVRLTRPAEALPILEGAYDEAATVAPNTKLQGDVLKSRGRAEAALGHVQQALHDFQDAFAIYTRAQEPRSEAMVLQEIGSIYSDARDFDHVLQYYAQSEEVFGQDPTLKLSAENNRAFALKDLGRYDEAAKAFRQALLAADQLQSAYLRANILENLAFTEALGGKAALARTDVMRGLAIAAHDPEAASERPFLLGVLAKIDADAGDDGGAAKLLDRMFQGQDLSKTPMTFRDFHQLAAEVYERAGDRDKAFIHLKAFQRLDDQGRELASSTNSALMSARFDFANQTAKIAQLKAGELKRDFLLAQSKARFAAIMTTVALFIALMIVAFVSYAFLTMRRSRNRIRAVNTELEASNQSLGKALKAKTEFLATTSHEIRTPLNGILGMTQVMLADGDMNAQTRERLTIVKSAGDAMSALLNDLLDVAKIETGHLSVERKDVELPPLLHDIACMWADKARTKGLTFDLDLSGCPPKIVEDGDRLRQILFNLLSNAVKFTELGGVKLTVEAVATSVGERLLFNVADTGIGIAPEDYERVFESFTQLDGGRARQHAGTGLGLSICRNLSAAMGGELYLDSYVGEGSKFTLDLPLTRAAAFETKGAHVGRDLASSRILVIEDNLLAQSMLRATLQPNVGRLEFVPSFEAAVATDTHGCDRILVDGAYLMRRHPDDAIGALARFIASCDCPVTAMWPSPSPELKASLQVIGVEQILAKPITPDTLLTALSETFTKTQPATEAADAA